MTKIYALIDPNTHMVRYVGKTSKSLETRLQGHLSCKMNAAKFAWVSELKRAGLVPTIVELEQCNHKNWATSEMFWIEHFRGIGADLLNRTDGGDGSVETSRALMLRQNFMVTEQLYALLAEEADKTGLSMSEIVRCAIDQYMSAVEEGVKG